MTFRLISIYLAFEAITIAIYCWLLRRWIEWKAIGPDGFPGSPDASALYFGSSNGYQWSTGFLEGVWFGGIACFVLSQFSSDQRQSRGAKAVAAALVIAPLVALIAGHLAESRL